MATATARASQLSALSIPPSSSSSAPRQRVKPGLRSFSASAHKRSFASADYDPYIAYLSRQVYAAFFSPESRFYWLIAAGLGVLEVAVLAVVIRRIGYTEIDFSTYLVQARLFYKGTREYSLITGPSGPCVYPALHLYLHTPLDFLTAQGSNLVPAQWLYAALYLATQALVFDLYRLARIPPIVLPLLIISKRLHSLYPLRMFNDCWTMFFLYAAFNAVLRRRWRAGSMLFSAALGIKMNALLFAPAFAVVYLRSLGLARAFQQGLLVLLIQVLISLPFTLHHPSAYFHGAFDFNRAFLYKWTVNLRLLPEATFLSPRTARLLLAGHGLGVAAWMTRWLYVPGAATVLEKVKGLLKGGEELSARFILLSLFTANLLGMTFSRSLHYQFYAWYAHQLPMLLYFVRLHWGIRLAIWYGIETAWLTFPSTSYSSSCLILAHATLLIGLWRTPTDPPVIPLAEGEPLLSPPLVSPPLNSPTSPILGARSPRLGRNNSYSKFR
ncbi:ALG3-domain-containing protein [Tilletiopsis washingtonensis]|uniref:Dol-P-Man:Man(5)GlcNAc(2)-PP-Dol alpha-1,3-mannosyltransferase n=1 Tax=Tilletiopsis washingtonensis TaxID=58919 RepID=A0A316Z8E1_9BASI|nr:ALG3-domain-containing protein [Tilletiopsis washingtonensis]PWN96505.1 ALG3-domain-containing protein [Tilletiopsis washingtonensis]